MRTLGIVYFAGILSAIFTVASTAVNGIFASALVKELSDLLALQCASIVSGALSFIVLGYLVLFLWKGTKICLGKPWENWTYALAGTLLCATAIVIAVALGWSYAGISRLDNSPRSESFRSLFCMWCGLWATSSFSQAFFYCLFLYFNKRSPERRLATTLHAGVGRTQPDLSSRSVINRMFGKRESPSAPKIYAQPSLPPFKRFYSRPDQVGSAPASFSFPKLEDRWSLDKKSFDPFSDNTRVSHEYNPSETTEDTTPMTYSNKNKNTHQWSWNRESQQQQRSQSRTDSPESFIKPPSIPEIGEIRPPSPSYQMQRSSSSTLRPRGISESSSIVEEHIHPLFRSSSPSTPPSITLGTTVTASPIAGQTISMHALRRIRSTASMSTPDLPSRSPLSRFTEEDEKDEEGEDERNQLEEGREGDIPGSASFPIPPFVLAANNRSSYTKYVRGRGNS